MTEAEIEAVEKCPSCSKLIKRNDRTTLHVPSGDIIHSRCTARYIAALDHLRARKEVK